MSERQFTLGEAVTYKVGDRVWLDAKSWEVLGIVEHVFCGQHTVRIKRVDGGSETTICRAGKLRLA